MVCSVLAFILYIQIQHFISDKDVCLMREHFNLDHIDYEHMSPVIIPRGYTKLYIEGKITHQDQVSIIRCVGVYPN